MSFGVCALRNKCLSTGCEKSKSNNGNGQAYHHEWKKQISKDVVAGNVGDTSQACNARAHEKNAQGKEEIDGEFTRKRAVKPIGKAESKADISEEKKIGGLTKLKNILVNHRQGGFKGTKANGSQEENKNNGPKCGVGKDTLKG